MSTTYLSYTCVQFHNCWLALHTIPYGHTSKSFPIWRTFQHELKWTWGQKMQMHWSIEIIWQYPLVFYTRVFCTCQCTPSPTRAIIYNAHCLLERLKKQMEKKQSLLFRRRQYVFDWCGPLWIISGSDKIWWIIGLKKKGMFFSILFKQVLIIFL